MWQRAGARGSEPGQFLLMGEECRLKQGGAGLQFVARGFLRRCTSSRGGRSRGRGGGGRRGGERGLPGGTKQGQLLLTGEEVGPEIGDARLQVVAQGLFASGVGGGGGRPLEESC